MKSVAFLKSIFRQTKEQTYHLARSLEYSIKLITIRTIETIGLVVYGLGRFSLSKTMFR